MTNSERLDRNVVAMEILLVALGHSEVMRSDVDGFIDGVYALADLFVQRGKR